jgi:hypothetical protein
VTTQEHLCRVCSIFGQTPVHYESPYVCHYCRSRMARQLVGISDQWLLLDATPGGSQSERITGSKEAPLGARVDALDQMLPVTERSAETIHDWISDQIGAAPAAVVLDAIADEWLQGRRRDGFREHRPVPTVANLTAWLRFRLEWACSHLPDSIDSHAAEIRELHGRLHALNGNVRSRDPEPVPATPCKKCGQIALVKVDGTTICTQCSQYSGPFADLLAVEIAKFTAKEAA